MKELERIKKISEALDVNKQLEKALQFIKEKNLKNPFFDGFYEMHLDINQQIVRFKIDYSPHPLIVFFLSLRKDYKSFEFRGSDKVEIENPIAQEKVYKEGKTDRATSFFSIQYLQKVADEIGFELETFEFGNSIIQLSIMVLENKPVVFVQEPVQVIIEPKIIPEIISKEEPKEKINKNKKEIK